MASNHLWITVLLTKITLTHGEGMPRTAIVEFNTKCEGKHPEILQSINCNNGLTSIQKYIHIIEDTVVAAHLGNHPNRQRIENKLFEAFSNLCNSLEICRRNHEQVFEFLKEDCKESSAEEAQDFEVIVKFWCLERNESAENLTIGGGTIQTTTAPQAYRRPPFGLLRVVLIGLAIFTTGAVFTCAVIYLKNNCKRRSKDNDSELDDDYDMSTYAEIDYGQISSASATPEAPLPPTAGTPHPHLMPLYYSTAKEPRESRAVRKASSRRKMRGPSRRRRDQPPNYLPPDPRGQSSGSFHLRPPNAFKKNQKGLEARLSDDVDTLVEENCAYDYGVEPNTHQEEPTYKNFKYLDEESG